MTWNTGYAIPAINVTSSSTVVASKIIGSRMHITKSDGAQVSRLPAMLSRPSSSSAPREA
jgi:hypothetical protein